MSNQRSKDALPIIDWAALRPKEFNHESYANYAALQRSVSLAVSSALTSVANAPYHRDSKKSSENKSLVLQKYQLQLMLLELNNKRRLLGVRIGDDQVIKRDGRARGPKL